VARLGDAAGLATVWSSPPFHHCCFTVLDRYLPAHASFTARLLSMDASDPKLCEPMELEYVNRWVPFDAAGYALLIEAVQQVPIVVGETAIAT
jgi:ABC-type phosphate/phosphonate transport system substrate-binding protein